MIYDRMVGIFSAAIVLVSLTTLVGVLMASPPPYIDALIVSCFLACMVPLFYLQRYFAQRDGESDDQDGLDLWPIIRALPLWATCITAILVLLVLLILASSVNSIFGGVVDLGICLAPQGASVQWLSGRCHLSIPKDDLGYVFTSLTTLSLSFIFASFLLFRRPTAEPES